MSILDLVKKHGKYREIAPGEYAGPCPKCGGAVRFRINLEANAGKCQTCEFALSGQETTTESAFDADKMQSLIGDTRSRVMSQCPAGAPEWLAKNRPDVVSHLNQICRQVDAAYEAQSEEDLQKALELFEKYYLAAWQRYKERPQVIARCKAEGGDCVCCGDCREGEDG